MTKYQESLLADNVRIHFSKSMAIHHELREVVSNSKKYKFFDLAAAGTGAERLLRYPVLCETERDRDEIYLAMCAEGLGGSKMYQQQLVDIPGVDKLVSSHGDTSNAKNFSSRLLTIPVHQYMDEKRLNKLRLLLS
jgi:dTDP-4-amino-4,6-dideoxygalactose transaminase